jgi:hypothetical protein
MLDKSISEAIKDVNILTNGIIVNLATVLKPSIKTKVLSSFLTKNVKNFLLFFCS